jgi:hypothetical protein
MAYRGGPFFQQDELTSVRRMRESGFSPPATVSGTTPAPTLEHGVQGMKWGDAQHLHPSKDHAREQLSKHGYVQTTDPSVFRSGGVKGHLVRVDPHPSGDGSVITSPHKEKKESQEGGPGSGPRPGKGSYKSGGMTFPQHTRAFPDGSKKPTSYKEYQNMLSKASKAGDTKKVAQLRRWFPKSNLMV